jgi:hypothetical protein
MVAPFGPRVTQSDEQFEGREHGAPLKHIGRLNGCVSGSGTQSLDLPGTAWCQAAAIRPAFPSGQRTCQHKPPARAFAPHASHPTSSHIAPR